ncbi:MAG: histidinol-phosphate transaminase [Candidatus Handelsmanbacteria bacterium]|nr:histidinol-phosphate transaminase [Candidatus Handelsmanbacteria bacterium]
METERYFLPHIAWMEGYVPGEQPREAGFIKLNTNENPYPPSPLVVERLLGACNEGLRKYPDPGATGVRQRLSRLFGVELEQAMVGNGSDELLNIALRCFAGPGDSVVYPYPTYAYYEKLIQLQGARSVQVDFGEDFSLPESILVPGARLTLLSNPNSPSGTLLSVEEVEKVAARAEGLVLIDEAYVDFAAGGCLELLGRYPNVIFTRTMSKSFSLAGMRLGFGFAPAELVAGMWKVKDHYNVNQLSLVAAEAALDDLEHMRANAARIQATRQRLKGRLRELGFYVWDSQANFVLARTPGPSAAGLYEGLKERRILVRYFAQRRLEDCLRISIGTDGEINALLEVLEELLKK